MELKNIPGHTRILYFLWFTTTAGFVVWLIAFNASTKQALIDLQQSNEPIKDNRDLATSPSPFEIYLRTQLAHVPCKFVRLKNPEGENYWIDVKRNWRLNTLGKNSFRLYYHGVTGTFSRHIDLERSGESDFWANGKYGLKKSADGFTLLMPRIKRPDIMDCSGPLPGFDL